MQLGGYMKLTLQDYPGSVAAMCFTNDCQLRCPYCHNIIKSVNNEGLIGYFKMICIENLKDNEIPNAITKVPAIITADTNKIYVASEAFKWLQGVKYMRQQAINEKNNKIIQYNIYKNSQNHLVSGGPKSFINAEMSGISDNFSYTDIDRPQPKSFQEYGKDDQEVIITPYFDTKDKKFKLSQDQQNKKIKEIEKIREHQNLQISEIMKQEQLQAVIRAEREKIYNN